MPKQSQQSQNRLVVFRSPSVQTPGVVILIVQDPRGATKFASR